MPSERGVAVGIDFGSSRALAVVVSSNKTTLVRNGRDGSGYRATPLIAPDGHVVFPDRGTRPPRSAARELRGTWRHLGGRWSLTIGRRHTAKSLLAELFQKLANDVERTVRESPTALCIAVPPMMTSAARAEVLEAAATAGLRVDRLVNSTTALARGWASRARFSGNLVVADVGAGTSDFASVTIDKATVTSRAVTGSTTLGGIDVDNAILAAASEEFERRFGEPIDAVQPGVFRVVETGKIALVQRGEATMAFVGTSGKRGTIVLRARHLKTATESFAATARSFAGSLSTDFILKTLVLAGRQLHLPRLRDAVRPPSIFEAGTVDLCEEEMVAIGAALEAREIVEGRSPSTDVVGGSLRLALGPHEHTILQRGAAVPFEIELDLPSPNKSRRWWDVELRQGDDPNFSSNRLIRRIRLDHSARRTAPIRVRAAVDLSGVATLWASGDGRPVTMPSAGTDT